METSFYSLSGQSFSSQESQIAKLEQELSSGLAVTSAADDPAAYVGSAEDASTVSQLSAMTAGQVNITQTLGTATSALGDVATALDRIQSIALQAINGATSSADLPALGDEVGSGLTQILSLANSQSSDGNYVFAGTAKETEPFVTTGSGGVNYVGNDGTSDVEISPGVTVNAALSGSVFTAAMTGNGYASLSAASGNAGSATLLATGVSDLSAATAFQEGSSPVTISFAASADGALAYTATEGSATIGSGPVDTSDGATPTIDLDGVELQLSGTPADGDSFTMAPSRPQSVFAMVQQIQSALSAPGSTSAAMAQMRELIGNSLGTITQYQDRIAATSAKAGVVVQATETAESTNALASTNAEDDANTLTAADMPGVLTELQQRSTALQAAMKAFSVASQLDLFKYL